MSSRATPGQVQTVLGAVAPGDLGFTLPHEHTKCSLWWIENRWDYWELIGDEPRINEELAAYLGRIRYGRGGGARKGYRHGRRERELVGTFVIVDGAPGLEAALTALWGEELPIQRCTVHKHRNLLGHAPKTMHDELTEDYRDMIYAGTAAEIETRRKAFLRKWRLKCRAVADSLEEAGERLFAFTRLDPSQWKSARTTNAIERLNEEFRRRIKTQTVLPCAETVPMLLWALLASGQIAMRKVDGWETLSQPIEPFALDQAA
jgi:transposase-like protein